MSPKVLITASSFSHIVNFHLPYLRRLYDEGWEIHLACGGTDCGIPFISKKYSLPLKKRIGAVSNFHSAAKIRQIVGSNHYDLIITHTSLAAFFTRLALKGLKNRPRVINVVHGYLFHDNMPNGKRVLLELAERITAKQTDKILTMNESDTVWATKNHVAPIVHKIPGMGLDDKKFLDVAAKVDLGLSENDFVLIYPAEFSDRKNQRMLIESMTILPNRVKLLLPGNGKELHVCQELAKKFGVEDRVFFPGYLSDIQSVIRISDVAVSSSKSEGLPFNIMEAMFLGKPIVASKVKGNADLIENNYSGILFALDDKTAFADSVNKLMNDRDLATSMGKHAAEQVQQYRLDRVIDIVMNEYLH